MAPSAQPPPSRPRIKRRALALLAAGLCAAGSARADNAVIPDTPEQLGLRGSVGGGLQLQVLINGRDAREVIGFERDDAGRFRARRSELAAVGLKTGVGSGEAWVALDSLPGLSYRYDEAAQTLSISCPESLLAPKTYSAAPPRPAPGPVASDLGLALNYDVFGSTASWRPGGRIGFGAGSITLDARAVSSAGVLSQSGILGATAFTSQSALRLDTTWSYDDARGIEYRAGDSVTAGLPWTRPLRLGGFQASRGLGLRPDLVAGPTATVSGTAAVPSSADVYVNNFRIFSSPVEAGPFRIADLPAIGGAGSATLVLRDVTGKESAQAVPFFVSSRLLAPGELDYAAEAGFARRNYGVASFDYDPRLVGSATLRGGLFDWATLEAHMEGGAGVLNGGAGATFAAFQRASVDIAVAGSERDGRAGAQISLGVSTGLYGATLDVSTQRALGAYTDLAEATAPPGGASQPVANALSAATSAPLFSPLLLSTSLAPPRALDRIALSFPRVFDQVAANLAFVNQVAGDGSTSRIVSVGLTRNFKGGLSVFATAFADLAAQRSFGIMAGLSYNFGSGVSASTQSTLQARGFSQATEIGRTAGQDVGDYGGEVSDQEGLDRYLHASAAYQSSVGRATATVTQYGAGASSVAAASGEFAGGVAVLGGGVAFSPQIPDAFAMVDAGAPNVTVLEDNRTVGQTGASGRLLVPGLRSFQDNRIGIDPTTLPLSAQTGATEMNLRPRPRSGVVADFRVRTEAHDAEVLFIDAAGKPLPVGSRIEGPGGGVVGYDGRAYLTDLAPHNAVTLRVDGAACVARFDYAPRRGAAHPTIGPVVCKAAG